MELAATAAWLMAPTEPEAVVRVFPRIRPGVLLVVAVGGLIGSAVREAVATAIPADGFPWNTLTVNLAGAALIGLLLARVRHRRVAMGFLVVGVGGSATTFSALVLDTVLLAEARRPVAAVVYLLLSVVGGFMLAAGTVRLGRRR